jgi:hypothetical protein
MQLRAAEALAVSLVIGGLYAFFAAAPATS